MDKKRTIFYFDGFNLHHGMLKNTPQRWLDLEKFAKAILPRRFASFVMSPRGRRSFSTLTTWSAKNCGNTRVEYSLPKDNNQIFAKQYRTVLPSKMQLKRLVQAQLKR